MNKQEIARAAKKWAIDHSNAPDKDTTPDWIECDFKAGANFVNEKQPYTPADMEAFFSWATNNGWSYGELTELWYNDDEELEALKIEDVLKLWEQERRAK